MRMRGGDHIRSSRMHLRVNRKRGHIDRVLAFHYLAAVIHQDQIGDANLAEMHSKRIHPKMIRTVRIPRRNVAGYAFIKTVLRE